ncbi:uncharacterized protein V6R79_011499 [Siganus canaliculatus]
MSESHTGSHSSPSEVGGFKIKSVLGCDIAEAVWESSRSAARPPATVSLTAEELYSLTGARAAALVTEPGMCLSPGASWTFSMSRTRM